LRSDFGIYQVSTAGLSNFIEYAKGFPNVWFARRIDIARHWMAQFPAG